MAKGNNKRLRQSMADVELNGRKFFAVEDDAEIFLAKRAEDLVCHLVDQHSTVDEIWAGKKPQKMVWDKVSCEQNDGSMDVRPLITILRWMNPDRTSNGMQVFSGCY